jgi:hypothetical protein
VVAAGSNLLDDPLDQRLRIGRLMRNWFEKNLGDAMLAGESMEHVKTLFLAEYARASHPADMAIFFRHESEGRLHCEARIYFSPASAAVAEAVGAVPCARPASDGLGLLVGSAESWTTCDPGNGNEVSAPGVLPQHTPDDD